MLKIIQGTQVKELDRIHQQSSGQRSHELMERAAEGFVGWFLSQGFDRSVNVAVVIGGGNNGGDGLAIGRLLFKEGFLVTVVTCFEAVESLSTDAKINWESLPVEIPVVDWTVFPFETQKGILIDALLGVGFSGKLRDKSKLQLARMNSFKGKRVAVDIPSGLPSDQIGREEAVMADFTVSFAFPKLSLLFPGHARFVGELVVIDIGIDQALFSHFDSNYYYIQEEDIQPCHRIFHRFSHKGDMGKVLVVGGSPGKMGALVLSCLSALRTGAGMVTGHLDEAERSVLQVCVPEVMAKWGKITEPEKYNAIGIGPGWGLESRKADLKSLMVTFGKPMVIDADALNLLSEDPSLLDLVPEGSILTPHPGEFTRLVGESEDHLHRLELARDFAVQRQVVMVLKGANTVISLPDGRQLFNSSGTKYMATAGAGDVLTGMLTAFLGMGYSSENAAICGVYHHGLAGELAAGNKRRSLIASDIIHAIPRTYIHLSIH